MTTAFIGEVRLFAGTFAPRGWAFCHGQILQISQYTAVFSLLGVAYGGNGTSTFGLPDLRGRAAIGAGQSPGLGYYPLGEQVGTETVTLTSAELPPLSVDVPINIPSVVATAGDTIKPVDTAVLGHAAGVKLYSSSTPDSTLKSFTATGTIQGSSKPIDKHSPMLALNYIICLEGIYPQRN